MTSPAPRSFIQLLMFKCSNPHFTTQRRIHFNNRFSMPVHQWAQTLLSHALRNVLHQTFSRPCRRPRDIIQPSFRQSHQRFHQLRKRQARAHNSCNNFPVSTVTPFVKLSNDQTQEPVMPGPLVYPVPSPNTCGRPLLAMILHTSMDATAEQRIPEMMPYFPKYPCPLLLMHLRLLLPQREHFQCTRVQHHV